MPEERFVSSAVGVAQVEYWQKDSLTTRLNVVSFSGQQKIAQNIVECHHFLTHIQLFGGATVVRSVEENFHQRNAQMLFVAAFLSSLNALNLNM